MPEAFVAEESGFIAEPICWGGWGMVLTSGKDRKVVQSGVPVPHQIDTNWLVEPIVPSSN